MVPELLALAFQSTCRLWQTTFTYLQGDSGDFCKYLISQNDRISRLPDDILYSIISLLTVRDAVKASILSRTWRYLCLTMPDLNFDLNTLFGELSHTELWNGETPRPWHHCPKYKREFVKILNQFVKSYLGTKISYFRISFCLKREYSCSIDHWVRFAVRMGVEKLELDFICLDAAFVKEKGYNNLYTVSLQLLSEASKLKHLRLCRCILKSDLTVSFNSLTNLSLVCIPLANVELQMVLCNCPNLEWLTLKYCTLPVKVCISDLFSLKFFALPWCEGLQNLELSATNLKTFEVSARRVIKISFSNVPKLENVFFNLLCHNGMPYIFGEVAKVLPQLKTLSISTFAEYVDKIPASPTAFTNVKQLDLYMTQYQKYDLVKIIAPLLSVLPLLQKLYVMMPYTEYFERRVEELPGYQHAQLKEIEIGGFRGTWNQIEFALYLLENAVALEQMVIDAGWRLYLGSGSWRNVIYPPLWYEEKRKFIYDQLLGKVFSRNTEVIIREPKSWPKELIDLTS